MKRLARRSRSEFAGERTSGLQQAQLAGARYRFGAPSNLELAKDVPVVSFDGNHGEEKPLADLTVRESLGNELQYFQLALAQWLDKGLGSWGRGQMRFVCALRAPRLRMLPATWPYSPA